VPGTSVAFMIVYPRSEVVVRDGRDQATVFCSFAFMGALGAAAFLCVRLAAEADGERSGPIRTVMAIPDVGGARRWSFHGDDRCRVEPKSSPLHLRTGSAVRSGGVGLVFAAVRYGNTVLHPFLEGCGTDGSAPDGVRGYDDSRRSRCRCSAAHGIFRPPAS